MPMNHKTLLSLGLLLLCLTLTFSQAQSASSDEEFQLGLVLPLTGSLEAVGNAVKNASELALEEINQTAPLNISFVVEDSASTAEGAVTAFNNLIEQGVTAIIGPVTSSASEQAFPIAQESGILTLSPLAAAGGLSEIGDYVFQANLTTDVVIPNGVALTQASLGYQNVAILVDTNDLFSQSAYEVLLDSFEAQNINVVATETLVTDDTDFSAQLGRIQDAEPDAIFISTLPLEGVGILQQAKELGLSDESRFIIPFAFSTDEIALAQDAAEGVITFSTWTSFAPNPGNQAFVDAYSTTYGTEPSRFLAQGYASVYIFAQALQNATSTDAADLRDALADIQNLDTILGQFSFDETGKAIYNPIMLVVNNAQFEVFE